MAQKRSRVTRALIKPFFLHIYLRFERLFFTKDFYLAREIVLNLCPTS